MQLSNPKLEARLQSLVTNKRVSRETVEKVKEEFFSKLDLHNPSKSQTAFISPDTALVLYCLSDGNRDISPSHITRYERDIVAEVFKIGDSAWMLDENYSFTNGHHRALAIIACGKGMEQAIRIGVEKKEARLCDVGYDRNVLATIDMSEDIEKSKHYTKVNFSVARIALTYGKSSFGINWAKISDRSQPSIIDQFQEEFEFFGEDFKEVIHSGISAVFLKAYPYFKEQGREQELKMALNIFKRGGDTRTLFEMQDMVPNKEALKTLIVLHKHTNKKFTKERGGTVEKYQFFRTSNLLYAYFIGEVRSNDNVRENDEFPLRADIRDYCLNLKRNVSDETSGQIYFKAALMGTLDVFPDGEYSFSSFIPELLSRNPKLTEHAIRRELNSIRKVAPVSINGRVIRFSETDQNQSTYNVPKNGKYSWMNKSAIFISGKKN